MNFTHTDHALHGAMRAMWGDAFNASNAFGEAWKAISGGNDFADPFDYARTREAYSEAARRCWGAYMEQRRARA